MARKLAIPQHIVFLDEAEEWMKTVQIYLNVNSHREPFAVLGSTKRNHGEILRMFLEQRGIGFGTFSFPVFNGEQVEYPLRNSEGVYSAAGMGLARVCFEPLKFCAGDKSGTYDLPPCRKHAEDLRQRGIDFQVYQ